MSGRRYHMHMNIAGFMRNNKFPDGYDCFEKDDGTPMSPGAAFTYLNAEQAKGHKVIPCSSKCGNPCEQAGCAGFDYHGGGCPGYPIDELTTKVWGWTPQAASPTRPTGSARSNYGEMK